MKTPLLRHLPTLAGVILIASMLQAVAAGTAFTYQGRLRQNGAPVTGSFDLQFKLYDAAAVGAQLGTTVALEDVSVANGLFSVLLDFGANVFTGDNRWLEISLRQGAETGDYATLNPRRLIAATPYAVQAGTVANVPAASITGSIPDAQLSRNVALLSRGPTFAGTVTANAFQGSGAGLTGIPGALRWQEVTGTEQQAQPNTGYMANSPGQVSVILPGSPFKGDVVRVSGVGAGGWMVLPPGASSLAWTPVVVGVGPYGLGCIASSADGSKLVTGDWLGQLYTSTDSGLTWTPHESARLWFSVASSADGTKLVAVDYGGRVYTSADSGFTWTGREISRVWHGVATSADGTKLVAVVGGATDGDLKGQIFTSTDSGVTWTPRESVRAWFSVASSADGNKLVAVVYGGQIYTSTDTGVTWTPRATVRWWNAIASSANGDKLVAVVGADYLGQIYTSTDSGVTWTAREANRRWQYVASSADGNTLIASEFNGHLYTSANSGVSWFPQESARWWYGVATSADGSKMFACGAFPSVYISPPSPALRTPLFVGNQNAAIELQFIGSTWRTLSQQGTITSY